MPLLIFPMECRVATTFEREWPRRCTYIYIYIYVYVCVNIQYILTRTHMHIILHAYMDIDIDCRSGFYPSFRNQHNFKGGWDLNPNSIRVTWWWVLPYSWCPIQHPETRGSQDATNSVLSKPRNQPFARLRWDP